MVTSLRGHRANGPRRPLAEPSLIHSHRRNMNRPAVAVKLIVCKEPLESGLPELAAARTGFVDPDRVIHETRPLCFTHVSGPSSLHMRIIRSRRFDGRWMLSIRNVRSPQTMRISGFTPG